MSTTQTVELTLDTTEGVEQFLEHVQDVVFAASRYEADALELAMTDPTHALESDVLADQLHELYARMRVEIAACASRGGMTIEEATELQAQYNELVEYRNQLKEVARPMAMGDTEPAALHTQRKTFTFDGNEPGASVAITASRQAKKSVQKHQASVAPKTKSRPKTKKALTSTKQTVAPPRRPAAEPKIKQSTTSSNLPSPGIMKPSEGRSWQQLPLLSMVVHERLIERIEAHSRPKQLEFKIKAVIDGIEAEQTDRLAAWLGDGCQDTFSFIKTMSLAELYNLAALPILELRTELAAQHIRPESLLHWVKVVTDIQAVFQVTTDQTVGEVVVSALVLQELSDAR